MDLILLTIRQIVVGGFIAWLILCVIVIIPMYRKLEQAGEPDEFFDRITEYRNGI